MSAAQQLGVTAWTLPERGPAGLAWAAAAGFDLVHVDARDAEAEGPDRLRATARELGIRLAGVSAVGLETIGISGSESLDCVSDAVELCELLGAGYLYLPSFEAATIVGDDDLARTAELLRHALALAGQRRITVATENTLDVDRLPALFDAVGHPELELLFDTQNPAMRAQSAPGIARLMAARIRSFVHVKDGWGALGESRIGKGDAEVGESVRELMAAGFSGTFVFESDYRSGDLALAHDDRQRLADLAGWPPSAPEVMS